MAVFIGISRRRQLLKLTPGQKSFWCIHRSRKLQPDDLLLLYFPTYIGAAKSGIRQIYRITGLRQGDKESDCVIRSMATIDTELLFNLDERITAKDMKADEIVSEMGALRRNMQGVTFTIESGIWPALRDMIIARNPNVESALPHES